jgi:exodeoxyribonuclease III
MKKFVSWNVNGIRACLGKDFYKSFESLDADIFCLQETKMQEGQAELELPGYYQYWNYAEKKGYSGTAIFTKEEPIEVTYGIGIDEHDHEGRVITAEFKDYYFITVYVPNSQDGLKRLEYRMKWEDDFLDYIKELDKIKPVIYCGDLKESPSRYKSKPIIICGDLNVAATEIDLKNPKSNVKNPGFTFEEREKFQKLLNAGFTDSFRYLYPDKRDAYTWWSYRFNARKNNAGWRIDYFLVSDFAKDRIKDSKIHANILGSDHCPIELDFDL